MLVLAGCGGGFHGREEGVSANGTRETIVINADGTYIQTITCRGGKVLQNNGEWSVPGPEYRSMPGIQNLDDYIELKQLYGLSTCSTSNASVPQKTDTLDPKSMFNLPASEVQTDRATAAGWVIFLRIAFLVYWIWAIVDVCRRDFGPANSKVGWVLCVVLLGCLGAGIYHAFGRSAGRIVG